MKMPTPDAAVLAAPRRDRRGAAPDRAGRRGHRLRAPSGRLRERRADRLSPAADGRGAAGDDASRSRRCCAIASERASRSCRAAPAPRCRAARCRSPTACCSAWPSSTASARSTSTTACVVVEPGVTNLAVSQAVEHAGFYYAPDPSSQIACTIGGNVAENSGGVHCLKYGMTTNNVLGCEMVLIDGEIVAARRQASRCRRLRSARRHHRLRGAARRRHRSHRAHPARSRRRRARLLIGFASVRGRAANASPRIIGAGIIPGGMEMMDRPAIHAAEAFVHAGYPLDVEALADRRARRPAGRSRSSDRARSRRSPRDTAPRRCRVSHSEEERLLFWAGRKAAFPAVGRISPDYYCMDGTIPRGKTAAGAAAACSRLSERYGLARRQRVSCRRRQSASADPLRRQQARRDSSAPRRSAPTSCGSASRSAAC